MEARIATSILVSALIRKAEASGGFAALLTRGDAARGALVVILVERGGAVRLVERVIQADGHYRWAETASAAAESDDELQKFLARRRKYDPDLWVLELNVPSSERFTAEMNALN